MSSDIMRSVKKDRRATEQTTANRATEMSNIRTVTTETEVSGMKITRQ